MKIWMINDGEKLILINGGGIIDLRNTSENNPVEVNDEIGQKLLVPGIIMQVHDHNNIEQSQDVDSNTEQDVDWDNMNWHQKCSFAKNNGYTNHSLKTNELNKWYKCFISENQI